MDRDKIVVITGGSSGIGLALAKRFASEGYQTVICGRNREKLETAKKEIKSVGNGRVWAMTCDVSKREDITRWATEVKTTVGAPDVLINNAGVFIPGKIQDEQVDDFFLQLNTNLVSTYLVTREFMPKMIERKSGSIYNVCSTASLTPYINGGSYCISKYGQYGMTKVLREELKEHKIRVTAVIPGATLTASWEGTDLPPERFIDPNDLADLVYQAEVKSTRTVVEELLVRPMEGDIV